MPGRSILFRPERGISARDGGRLSGTNLFYIVEVAGRVQFQPSLRMLNIGRLAAGSADRCGRRWGAILFLLILPQNRRHPRRLGRAFRWAGRCHRWRDREIRRCLPPSEVSFLALTARGRTSGASGRHGTTLAATLALALALALAGSYGGAIISFCKMHNHYQFCFYRGSPYI
jgi:hypothetical protein